MLQNRGVVNSVLLDLGIIDEPLRLMHNVTGAAIGCGRLRAFLTVTLPQIRGSVVTGMLFAFVSSLDEVVVAILVSCRNVTVTKVMFDSLRDEIDSTITAVSSLMIVASFIGLGVALWLQRASRQRSERRV